MLSPCRSPVPWVVLPWVLQIADVVVLSWGLWFCRGFLVSALCVCVCVCVFFFFSLVVLVVAVSRGCWL